MRKLKVLVVEREPLYETVYREPLTELGFELLFATSAKQGRELFHKHLDIFAVSVGARIPDNGPLIQEMRASRPSLPILATSMVPEYREELKNWGCNREYEITDKTQLPTTFKQLAESPEILAEA